MLLHIRAYPSVLFLFIAGSYSLIWVYHILLLFSLDGGHIGHFQFS